MCMSLPDRLGCIQMAVLNVTNWFFLIGIIPVCQVSTAQHQGRSRLFCGLPPDESWGTEAHLFIHSFA